MIVMRILFWLVRKSSKIMNACCLFVCLVLLKNLNYTKLNLSFTLNTQFLSTFLYFLHWVSECCSFNENFVATPFSHVIYCGNVTLFWVMIQFNLLVWFLSWKKGHYVIDHNMNKVIFMKMICCNFSVAHC